MWKEVFKFGTVKLSLASELKFTVYDEDNWSNELLGECKVQPVKAGIHDDMCPMSHGSLFYSYKVDCAPGLRGHTCGEYAPSGMNSDLSYLYTSRNALNMTQELLAYIRMGQPLGDPLTFLVKQRDNDHPALSEP